MVTAAQFRELLRLLYLMAEDRLWLLVAADAEPVSPEGAS